ncbi:MAG: hypothetical protein MJZ34_05390 [Paludibacteraceae bacterium]|nr:hypothetical protein [Paludibacteraceae bacterium]
MKLINNLTTDKEIYNRRMEECIKKFGNSLPFNTLKEDEDLFKPWKDYAEELNQYLYTKETETDFGGVYLDTQSSLHWCKDYTEDCSRKYAKDYKSDSLLDFIETYGVADNIAQIKKFIKKQEAKGYDFGECLISITPILRHLEPSSDGWRWHKWGRYIGNFKHKHEYIYNENGIDCVLCFEIVPLKKRTIPLEEELGELW